MARRELLAGVLMLAAATAVAATSPSDAAEAGGTAARGLGALARDLMRSGGAVVVSDLSRCRLPSGAPGPAVTAVSTFDTLNLGADYLAMSNSHLFEGSDGRMLLEYFRIRIFPDEHAEVTLRRLAATTWEAVGQERSFRCDPASGGVTVRGLR